MSGVLVWVMVLEALRRDDSDRVMVSVWLSGAVAEATRVRVREMVSVGGGVKVTVIDAVRVVSDVKVSWDKVLVEVARERVSSIVMVLASEYDRDRA